MSISSVASSPAPMAKLAVRPAVNDHDADDVPAVAAPPAPAAPGTGTVIDKVA